MHLHRSDGITKDWLGLQYDEIKVQAAQELLPKVLTALDIARYFLAVTDEDAGEYLSHPNLQKLCYYAQGFNLAILKTPLFQETIQSWQHGPVVADLWQEFTEFGSGVIPIPETVDMSIYPTSCSDMLDEIREVYGQFSAWKLRDMTQDEPPWSNAWVRGPRTVISHDALKHYFSTLLVEEGVPPAGKILARLGEGRPA